VVGLNVILKLARSASCNVTAARELVADTSVPMVATKGDVVSAGTGFVTEPTCKITLEIKVSVVIVFVKVITLLTVFTSHPKLVEIAKFISKLVHVSLPSRVYSAGKVIVILDEAGTASVL
jgi:hypothetical protein